MICSILHDFFKETGATAVRAGIVGNVMGEEHQPAIVCDGLIQKALYINPPDRVVFQGNDAELAEIDLAQVGHRELVDARPRAH